jgi:hypothetical protein
LRESLAHRNVTQPVSFDFCSPQFAVESGRVFFSKGARLFSDGEFQVGEITDGSVDGVLVEGPIVFDAILGNLSIVRYSDGRRYQVAVFPVTGDLRPQDMQAGRVVINLDVPVVVILKIEDEAGKPMSGVQVSLNLPNALFTAEIQTDERGEIVLLGAAGRYSASVAFIGTVETLCKEDAQINTCRRAPHIREEFEIRSSDSGERMVVIRIPNQASG